MSTVGVLSLAALFVAGVTGVALAVGYDVRGAADSVALLELTSRTGRVLRSLHAWSSHLLLVLAVLHVIEHLARGSDRNVRFGVWLRLVVAVPLLLCVAISGFMLRGDAEGQLARQIVGGLLERVPWVGGSFATALLGAGEDLQLVYLHHAATLTIAVLLVAIEHSRRLWPGARSAVGVLAFVLVAGWLLPPSLHDGADPVTRGPWYFVGLQQLLSWLSRPGWLWAILLPPLGVLAVLPLLAPVWRRRAAIGSFAVLVLYALLGGWAHLVRGPGWGQARFASATGTPALAPMNFEVLVPERLSRPEGCLGCHFEVGGLGTSHAPKAIGCAACHLGRPYRPDAEGAHRGMIRVPGNLDSVGRTCGQSGCHDTLAARVEGALMARGTGLVSVDRFVFGESPVPEGDTPLSRLGYSPADGHLRQLCSSCHLGAPKENPGPATELSRGGGCVACHLSDDPPRTDFKTNPGRFTHSGLTLRIGDGNCFGCHSRSGRISLSYAGWWEAANGDRKLADGRTALGAEEDVHHQKGLSCIDCHTAKETMGDGKAHGHEEEATKVRCTTCHRVEPARSVKLGALDAEAAAIVRLRDGKEALSLFLVEDLGGEALTNATPLPDGTVEVRGKVDRKRHVAKPPIAACTALRGHERLSCQSCHSSWVPRCLGCHTQFDGAKPGTWTEYDVSPQHGPPTLGLFEREGRTSIEPFAPGMILTLNPPGAPAPDPLPPSSEGLIGKGSRFVRAYALAVPHTTTRKGRSCASCHQDPNALGYGQGRLSLDQSGAAPAWKFEPTYQPSSFDGLPSDAWIGFLQDPQGAIATRTKARPLERAAQERTLEVGACMSCHDPERPESEKLYRDFRQSRERLSPRCKLPSQRPL
ncbi:MAG: hypothetical protein ACYC8T_01930 [Myxococcaceae bacterium]